MALDYSKERRAIVREWGVEVRSLGDYHRDMWSDAMYAYEDYEVNDDAFTELRHEYLKLAGHPEYHY